MRGGDDVLDLGKVLDVVAKLSVEQPAVGHYDHAVEQRLVQPLRTRQARAGGIGFNQLEGGPGDRVGLARACRVLDQVAVPHAVVGGVVEQAAHHIQLVIAREDQGLPRQRVGRLAFQQHEVLDDASQALLAEHLFPQIRRLVAIGVGRIALALVVALVEGQEEGGAPRQFGGHEHLVGVHGHVHQGPAELQQRLAGIAPFAVLLLAVVARGLAGPGVLELNRDQRQAVEEEHHVDLFGRVRLRITDLAGDAEDVGGEVLVHPGGGAGQRRGVHQHEERIVNRQAFLQQVQHAVLFDQPVEALEDLALPVGRITGLELDQLLALRGLQELPEEARIERVFGVEVRGQAQPVEGMVIVGRRIAQALRALARQVLLDRLFQRDFLGVADHGSPLCHLDLTRDCSVDQGGLVFLECGDLAFLDRNTRIGLEKLTIEEFCDLPLLLKWKRREHHHRKVIEAKCLTISYQI